MARPPKPVQAILAQLGISEASTHTFKFGGVVGKLTIVVLGGFAGAVGLAKYTTGNIQVICVLAVLATTVLSIRWILGYAEKHPDSATLEGSEIILWRQQVILAAKGMALPKDSPVIPDPEGSPPQLSPPEGTDE